MQSCYHKQDVEADHGGNDSKAMCSAVSMCINGGESGSTRTMEGIVTLDDRQKIEKKVVRARRKRAVAKKYAKFPDKLPNVAEFSVR